MKLDAPQRRPVTAYRDEEMGIWLYRPVPVAQWIILLIDAIRGSYQYPLEGLKVTVGDALHREILMTLREGPTAIFGAEYAVDYKLDVPFRVTWVSREEQALQSLVDQL